MMWICECSICPYAYGLKYPYGPEYVHACHIYLTCKYMTEILVDSDWVTIGTRSSAGDERGYGHWQEHQGLLQLCHRGTNFLTLAYL